jgi:hypothetical protein
VRAEESPVAESSPEKSDPTRPQPAQGTGGFSQHPVIQAAVPDPDNLPKTHVLSGYLGSSSRPGFARIYLGLDLRAYVEVLATAILYAEAPDPSDTAAPTKIIIDASSPVAFTQTLEASFLEGAIAAAYPIACDANDCLPLLTIWSKCVVGGLPKTKGCGVTPEGHPKTKGCPAPEGHPTTKGCPAPEGHPTTKGCPAPEGHPTTKGCPAPEGHPTTKGSPAPEGY